MKLAIAGPFTLRIGFVLTKDGREDVGNLLSKNSREWSHAFPDLESAVIFLESAFNPDAHLPPQSEVSP